MAFLSGAYYALQWTSSSVGVIILAMNKILVTGFEPFDGSLVNPSMDVALLMGGIALPVSYERSAALVLGYVQKQKPDLVIHLGLARGRKAISLETKAFNMRRSAIPDRDGVLLDGQAIADGKPAILETKVEASRLSLLLDAAGIASCISSDPGRYVCNSLYYSSLLSLDCPCLFVHLPGYDCMDRQTMLQAVRLICLGFFSRTIMISSCLLNESCRYDGKGFDIPALRALSKDFRIISHCPERSLGCPRPCCEIKEGRVIDSNGKDMTKAFEEASQAMVQKARGNEVRIAFLKDKSPSCGTRRIYDGTFTGKLISGSGTAASALENNGIECIACLS